jgi:iron(III) transport system permease protein
MYSKASRASTEKEMSGWGGALACAAFGLVTFLAVLPHIGVLLTSVCEPGRWYKTVIPAAFTGEHYRQALTASDSFGSIVNSIKYASAAMTLDICLGVLIGYLIVRTTVRGRAVLDALCMLPLAVPGLVLAFGYVAMSQRWPMGKAGPLGDMILGADPNPVPLLVMAYAVRRLPYIVRSTVAGLEQTSGELEEAAVNLGASRFTAVRRVIVPLIMANLIAGGLLVFSFSMLEVSDSMILAQQSRHYPITRAIFAFTERLGDGAYIASAMGAWGMALLAVTLVGASVLLGKKLGSIFRV